MNNVDVAIPAAFMRRPGMRNCRTSAAAYSAQQIAKTIQPVVVPRSTPPDQHATEGRRSDRG